MAIRLAGVILAFGLLTGPCGAVVMAPGDGLEPIGGTVAEAGGPAWSAFILPAAEAPRGALEKIFTAPNIAVVLAGLAWMSLVRRRLGKA